MAAPAGNKNAVGNSGGKPYSDKNRKKAAMLKGIVIAWAVKKMKDKDIPEDEKKEIVMRLLPNCVPKSIEVTGDEGAAINFTVIGYGKEDPINNISKKDGATGPIPIPSKETSGGVSEQSS